MLAIDCFTSRPIPSVLPRCLPASAPKSSLLPSDCVVTALRLAAALHNTGQSLYLPLPLSLIHTPPRPSSPFFLLVMDPSGSSAETNLYNITQHRLHMSI